MLTPETLAQALSDRLGDAVPQPFGSRFTVTFGNGQRATARVDAEAGQVHLETPLDGAHAAIPGPLLAELMRRNAPDGGIAGGTVRVRPGQDYLEIANTLPLTMSPGDVAQILINQANAAGAIVEALAAAVAESLQ